MIVIGLTGSIGMGKTTTASLFAEEGAAVFDADAAVADLYGPSGAAVPAIEAAFPGCAGPAGVDRQSLSASLLADPAGFARLEAIVHPFVAEARARFLDQASAEGRDIVVLDVPLLFESGQADDVDVVVVVSTDPAVQKSRVLQRPDMSPDKLDAILARQTPDSEKRARADHVIETGRGLEDARRQVRSVIASLRTRHA